MTWGLLFWFLAGYSIGYLQTALRDYVTSALAERRRDREYRDGAGGMPDLRPHAVEGRVVETADHEPNYIERAPPMPHDTYPIDPMDFGDND